MAGPSANHKSEFAMNRHDKPSRRSFIQSAVASTVAISMLDGLTAKIAAGPAEMRSQVFRVNGCPPHDGELRHIGNGFHASSPLETWNEVL